MKTALSFLMLTLAVTPAAAQLGATAYTPARLKSQVTVSSDIVRIGDLVENAGPSANTPIFRAPDLGQTGAVPVRAVLDAVRPHGLVGVDVRGMSEISDLIAAQRAYEMNAKVITATDQMLQSTTQMLR